MNKGDLISRKALVKALLAWRDKFPPETAERYSFGVKTQNRFNAAIRGGIRKALMEVETAPAVDAVPVMHGRWEYHKGSSAGGNDVWTCSECHCGYNWVDGLNYCPNCGAKMDG